MSVRDVANQVNMIRKIPDLSKYDKNPFKLLPANMAMLEHQLIWHIMDKFCEITFAFKIADMTPSIGGWSDVEDVVRVYDKHRSRVYGGFWGNKEISNWETENAIRKFLTNMGWSAEQLAAEYDRQHGEKHPHISTGNAALDAKVNHICLLYTSDAADE